MKLYLVAIIVALLSACSAGGLEGTYKSDATLLPLSLTFKKSGKVLYTIAGVTVEMDYKVEDGKVKLIQPAGVIVMDILEDGSIKLDKTKLVKQK
jgi:hypothetical protein